MAVEPDRGSLPARAAAALSALWAAALGALPHVLHHVGPLAGAALLGGATGSLLFAAVGFLAATPFLRRVHRRTGGWRLPLALLAAMAVAFTVSTLVVGPAISSDDDDDPPAKRDAPARPAEPDDHDAHH